MSKKISRSDKYRDEITKVEEGGLHSHEQDVRNGGLVVRSWSTIDSGCDYSLIDVDIKSASTHRHRQPRDRRSPTPSNTAKASSGSAVKRHNPKKEHSHGPEE
ncbi:hypothetical protein N7523_007860 [Penicillium sp. IBT 18751x]|nr:hypothetical protein N7523_007860 [Penicillium sp. IBT 18751x]